jgi:hypothetical protein
VADPKTRRARLEGLRVDEVALVDRGANPEAHVLFWKRAVEKAPTKTEDGESYPAAAFAYVPDPEKPSTWKLRIWESPSKGVTARQVGAAVAALGPGGFRGNRVQIPAEDLPKVKAKVRAAWLKANPDRKPDEVPAVLKGDPIPQAKKGPGQAIAAWISEVFEKLKGGGGSPPSPDDVRERVETLLSVKPDGSEGGDDVDKKEAMEILAKLDDEQRKALVALVEKAGKVEAAEKRATEAEAKAKTAEEELAKALKKEGDDDQEAVLKALPEEVRKIVEPLLKAEREQRTKVEGQVSELQKAARRRDLREIAKSFDGFSVPEKELVDLLEKADEAGILDELQKVLKPASEAAAKIFDVLGSEAEGMTDAEAKLDAMAKELHSKASDRFPTFEAAYAEIVKRNPELYEEAAEGAQ